MHILPVRLTPPPTRQRAQGLSLVMVMVMMVLAVVSLLGIAGTQIALMSERSARNSRDQQIALQSAEAGLIDAEIDISNATLSTRQYLFDGKTSAAFPATGCGSSGDFRGLCAAVATGKPTWLSVDFSGSTSSQTVPFGTFSGRSFSTSGAGLSPKYPPRYIIEAVPVQVGDKGATEQEVLYRVTSMGFGPREDVQTVVQMIYRR